MFGHAFLSVFSRGSALHSNFTYIEPVLLPWLFEMMRNAYFLDNISKRLRSEMLLNWCWSIRKAFYRVTIRRKREMSLFKMYFASFTLRMMKNESLLSMHLPPNLSSWSMWVKKTPVFSWLSKLYELVLQKICWSHCFWS